jgi:predicted ArsR family transcriptional regulator
VWAPWLTRRDARCTTMWRASRARSAARRRRTQLASRCIRPSSLVERGLLEVEFRRLSGRKGPGAGRPAKLYRRSSRDLSVSLPARRYDLAGEVLATAIDRCAQDSLPIGQAVQAAARAEGRRIATRLDDEDEGAGARFEGTAERTEAREGALWELERAGTFLSRYGFESRIGDRELCLTNCPFDRLAERHTELVCTMNLALVGGVLEGLQARALTPRLAPEPGFCCVRVSC